MKNSLIMAAVGVFLCSSASWAMEVPKPESQAVAAAPAVVESAHQRGDRTLEEEKARLQKRLDKLNKMTPQEWESYKKKLRERREARRAKWESLTPEQKEAIKKRRAERRQLRQEMMKEHAPKVQ